MKGPYDPNCDSCRANRGETSLTPAPRILETPHWIISHAHPTSIRGWLVIVLARHCSAIHELIPEEAKSLGHLLSLTCQALHVTLGTEKEYVMQFAEASRFQHVHFHVIARLPDWPVSLRGARVMGALGDDVEHPLPPEVLTPLALQIREELLRRLSQSA